MYKTLILHALLFFSIARIGYRQQMDHAVAGMKTVRYQVKVKLLNNRKVVIVFDFILLYFFGTQSMQWLAYVFSYV